jgi:hypothetical protein
MKVSQEFAVGNHKIGYVSDTFSAHFAGQEFEAKPMPKFQKLPRRMTDAEIESELKPGMCEPGDILAFMENAPEECKDGNWNLFYTPAFVVFVLWFDFSGEWRVDAWGRGGDGWGAIDRVFSPATESKTLSSSSETLTPLTLEAAIEMVKKEGYRIFKEI